MEPMNERDLTLRRRIRFTFFPARCPLCNEVIRMHRLFCDACAPKALQEAGLRVFALTQPERVLEAAYVWHYEEDAVRRMIRAYKFSGEIDFRDAVGAAMGVVVRETWAEPFDVVTAVPATERRKKELGFDHTAVLAESMARKLELPFEPLLQKQKEAAVQHTLHRNERAQNVRGVYTAQPGAAGKHVLLADDIMTTGATLSACAEELYRAGAASVHAVCAATVGE